LMMRNLHTATLNNQLNPAHNAHNATANCLQDTDTMSLTL
jgi:hypothetical protein